MDWATLGGDTISAGLGYVGQMQTNAQNIQAAEGMQQQQQQFSEFMSDTAHQREVADLKAAGLNPVLSATGGAPMGGGSEATPNITSPLENVSSSVKQVAGHLAEIRNTDAETKQKKAQTGVSLNQQKLIEAQTAGARADARVKESEAKAADVVGKAIDTFKPTLDMSSSGWKMLQKVLGVQPDLKNVHLENSKGGGKVD